MKNLLKSKGFTLIELIVTIAVFGIIGIIVLAILVNTLRLSTKTTTLSSVRQNGNYALSQISKSMRVATVLTSPSSTSCLTTPTTVASPIIVNMANGSQVQYDCNSSGISITTTIPGQAPSLMPLVDTSKVAISSCQFRCSSAGTGNSPVIEINFTLSPNLSGSSNLPESSISPLVFQDSVLLRNITSN